MSAWSDEETFLDAIHQETIADIYDGKRQQNDTINKDSWNKNVCQLLRQDLHFSFAPSLEYFATNSTFRLCQKLGMTSRGS